MAASILHEPICPYCEMPWDNLANDLERLAHLLLDVLQTHEKPRQG